MRDINQFGDNRPSANEKADDRCEEDANCGDHERIHKADEKNARVTIGLGIRDQGLADAESRGI